jgi:hypothetical protein
MSNPVLDQYTISVETRDGFPMLLLRMMTVDMIATTYVVHPAFAHALSDELLRASAHAMSQKAE